MLVLRCAFACSVLIVQHEAYIVIPTLLMENMTASEAAYHYSAARVISIYTVDSLSYSAFIRKKAFFSECD